MPIATAENWALFFHLLGAFLLVSGVAVAGAAFEAARRRHSAAEVALLLGMARIGVLLVAVGSVLVLTFGLWLVHLEGIDYGAGWIDAALALFGAMVALGAIGGQGPKRARKLAEAGAESAELRRLLNDRLTLAINYLSALFALVIVALMVFKPGGPGG